MKRKRFGTRRVVAAALVLTALLMAACQSTQLSPEEQEALETERAARAAVMVGDWEGEISADGETYPVIFHIRTDRNGVLYSTMDSPSQGVYGFQVDRTRFDGMTLSFEIRKARFSYEGTIASDQQSVNGVFEQAGHSGETTLTKVPGSGI